MRVIQDVVVEDYDEDSRAAVAVAIQRIADAVQPNGVSLRFYAAGIPLVIGVGVSLSTLLEEWVREYTAQNGGAPR